jgi:hypothetical protein
MVQKNNYYNFLEHIINNTNQQTNYDADYDSSYDDAYYNRTTQEEFFHNNNEILITDISEIVQEEGVQQSSSNFYKYIIGSMIVLTGLSVSLSYFISKKRNKKIN